MFTTVITTVAGLVVGVLKDLLAMRMKQKHQEQQALMDAAGIVMKDRERASDVKDQGVSWTRRIIAFALTAVVIAPAILAFIDPHFVINIPITNKDDGWSFLFFSGGASETTTYIQLTW